LTDQAAEVDQPSRANRHLVELAGAGDNNRSVFDACRRGQVITQKRPMFFEAVISELGQ
jgi:hypothetical protein